MAWIENFVVICRGDWMEGEPPAAYELATRRVFDTRDEAERYAGTVARSREALVVAGRWHELRLPTAADQVMKAGELIASSGPT